MSQASEWATLYRKMREATPPPFTDPRPRRGNEPGPYVQSEVGTDGTMILRVNDEWRASLPAFVALDLARWILDTFGPSGTFGDAT